MPTARREIHAKIRGHINGPMAQEKEGLAQHPRSLNDAGARGVSWLGPMRPGQWLPRLLLPTEHPVCWVTVPKSLSDLQGGRCIAKRGGESWAGPPHKTHPGGRDGVDGLVDRSLRK